MTATITGCKAGITSLATALMVCLVSPTSHAGPPLLCHPLDIGAAQSLPWGPGPFDAKSSHSLRDLADETVRLLDTHTSVLARLETIRRATIYAKRDNRTATDLLVRMLARAAMADRTEAAHADALLDAGYLAACYAQHEMPTAVNGYELLTQAERLRPDDPAFDFACAMATVGGRHRTQHLTHLREAADGAPAGSLLAQNIEKQFGEIWRTLEQLPNRNAHPGSATSSP